MKNYLIGSFVLSVVFVAGFAHAEVSVSGSAVGDVNRDGLDVGASIEASADTSVQSRDTQTGKASGREAATGKATGRSETSATIDLPISASATATAKVLPKITSFSPITVSRTGLRLGTTSVQVLTASSVTVQSESEFKALVESIVASDPNVKVIKIENDSTEVDYQYNGRFFGVIPVKPVLRASVDTQGKVRVKYPWYEMFVKRTSVVNEATVSTAVTAEANASKGNSDINTRARVLVVLSNSLKSE